MRREGFFHPAAVVATAPQVHERERSAGHSEGEERMDWHELEKKKVTELRELAKDKAGVEGTHGYRKEQLVEFVARALGIEKPHLVAEGINKTEIKAKIRALKADVASALETKDRATAKRKRRQIHRLKRRIRAAAHLTH